MDMPFQQGYALVVGVGADLPNTITDATGLATILQDPTRCAYPQTQVQLCTSASADRDTILSGLDRLAKTVTPDATVIIYFSGHGYQVSTAIGQAYFLMPYGYDTQALLDTAISGQEFMQKLAAIPAQKLLVLLDCCHAGGIDNAKASGAQFVKAALPPQAQSLFAQGNGRVLIASSRADELSYAGKPYSAFTLALIEALAGQGVSEQDGYVRVADLALYAREMVPKRTQDQQHPILHFDGADNFVVAYYAAGHKQPSGLPYQGTPEIESTPGAMTVFDQAEQTVHGAQTNIAGNVQGSVLAGTFHAPLPNAERIDTAGGAFIGGAVTVGTGDFVGRDQISHNNEVRGDQIAGDNITAQNITGNTGIAIGRNARAHVSTTTHMSGNSDHLDIIFTPLFAAARQVSADKQAQAHQLVAQLQSEVAKAHQAEDPVLAELIQDFVNVNPAASGAVRTAFATAPLVNMTGPITNFVLKRLNTK